jgi:hypothetical protein
MKKIRKQFTISNSSDLMAFQSLNCDNCRKEKRCKHLKQLFVFDNQNNSAWFYDEEGYPRCDDYVPFGVSWKKMEEVVTSLFKS